MPLIDDWYFEDDEYWNFYKYRPIALWFWSW